MTYTRKEIIGNQTLYFGDCLEIMPTLGKVDAVVTDPPYGIGIAANPVRQKHEKKDWDNKTTCLDFLDLGIPTVIWGGNYFTLPTCQRFLVWDKLQPEDFSLAMCEYAWTNLKGPAKVFKKSVLSYSKNHPTQKPVELMKWCIGYLPDESNKILDPFMGSGTTLVACQQMGRHGIGIEIDPQYFQIACERVHNAWKQPDLFIEGVIA